MPNNNNNENNNDNDNTNNNTSNNNIDNTNSEDENTVTVINQINENNSNINNDNDNNNDNTNNNTNNNNIDNTDSEDENTVTVINQINSNNISQVVIETTFTTNDISNNVVITQDLKQIIEVYDDEVVDINQTVINEIKNYASLIKCENFHGKGTIDDYSELFIAASKIATNNIQMNLDVDIDGFNEFGQAADDLAKLFNSFILKLQNVNIINDSTFLNSVLDALKKIVNLSNVFGQFKKTILATTTIKIPKSAQDTRIILENVMDEVSCAMNYVNNFVIPNPSLIKGQLDDEDREIISKATETINNWSILCEHGVSIALANNVDINKIKDVNNNLKNKTAILKNATSLLLGKLVQYNIPR